MFDLNALKKGNHRASCKRFYNLCYTLLLLFVSLLACQYCFICWLSIDHFPVDMMWHDILLYDLAGCCIKR